MQRISTGPASSRRQTLLVILLALFALLPFGCQRGSSSSSGSHEHGVLHGRTPTKAAGVSDASVLTDGVADFEGGDWSSDLTAELRSRAAFVLYDLGQPTRLASAYLQADHDDRYVVEVSKDGQDYQPFWQAPSTPERGLRQRSDTPPPVEARYVRLRAEGGDGRFSVSEFQLFSDPSAQAAPRRSRGLPAGERLRSSILMFVMAAAGLVVLAHARMRWWWLSLLVGWVAWGAVGLVPQLFGHVDPRSLSLLRGSMGLLAAVVVLREVFPPRKYPAHRVVTLSTLGICAFVSFMSFFNLGKPQFYDQGRGQPSFIHTFDTRVYFPQAKYFEELGFDGVYLASVAAVADNRYNGNLAPLRSTELRDLTTHRMVRVADVEDQVRAIKGRFSEERWRSLLDDMKYFQDHMGPDFLRTLHDHGGNATPVWIAIARLLFANTDASDTTLLIGAALDPILLLLTFLAIGFTFGPRTAFVACVVFGANDFYMFGTNWGGATLRHDWMAYLGFGICALKRRWFWTAGIFLGLAALIRAFPVVVGVAAGLPVLWWVVDQHRTTKRWPSWATLREAHGDILKVALGAAACVVAALVITSIIFGVDRWVEWLHKVSLLSRDPHTNHVSLRSLVAGSDFSQARILASRMPLYIGLLAAYLAAIALGARRRPYHQAAALGILLIPVVFYPANYYIHVIFLLPLLATEVASAERPISAMDGMIWMTALGLCAAQYFTVLVSNLDLHFYLATVLLFCAITWWLTVLLLHDYAKPFGRVIPFHWVSSAPEPGEPAQKDAAAPPPVADLPDSADRAAAPENGEAEARAETQAEAQAEAG